VKRRLALNTASNIGTLFLKIAITFIMTPVLLSNLGRYDYGLWEMVMAIVGYMGILDMGVKPTVSRYAAMAIARNDEESLKKIYATAWFYLMSVGICLALALSIWGLAFPGSLAEGGDEDTAKYTFLLLILAAKMLLIFPAYTAESYLEAYQEYYLKNNVTIISSVLGSSTVFYFITPDNALVLMAGIGAIGMTSKYLFYVLYMQSKRSFLRPYPSRFSWSKLKDLFRFSVKTLIQGISTRIENATDSLVIGFVLGPATVPLYSIPANLVNYIRTIASNLTHVFMPYFSSLAATGERDKTRRVYFLGSKLTIGAVMVLAIGVLGLGQPFLELWIGGEIARSAAPILWLLVAFTCLPLLNPYSGRYLTAVNQHGVFARWGPVVAVSNLVLSLILIHPLGIYGVALGSLLPGLVFQPFILRYCCRSLEVPIRQYLVQVIVPVLLPALLMAGVIGYLEAQFPVESYISLLAIAAAGGLTFCLAAYFSMLSRGERRELAQIIGIKRNA